MGAFVFKSRSRDLAHGQRAVAGNQLHNSETTIANDSCQSAKGCDGNAGRCRACRPPWTLTEGTPFFDALHNRRRVLLLTMAVVDVC